MTPSITTSTLLIADTDADLWVTLMQKRCLEFTALLSRDGLASHSNTSA